MQQNQRINVMVKIAAQVVRKVYCRDCIYSGLGNNYLIDCRNKRANPGGFKVGVWAKNCYYYGKKTKQLG